jgi:hypothetical protein
VVTAPDWLDELQLTPGPPWHAMGTRALELGSWLLVDDARTDQLARKRKLLSTSSAVVSAASVGSEAVAAEAAALVLDAAPSRRFETSPVRPPLEEAALAVQEDLCVLGRHGESWTLDAGVVCFPSMWKLPDKLGLSLAAVHGPVPAYADELAERVDRFLDRLRADRPVWRRNWLLHDSPELHLPAPPPPPPRPPAVPDDLWLRSERQTLRRLPRTGGVLFTIRTQQVPMATLTARPDVAAGIARAVRAWSPELVRYRGAERWRDDVLAWLDGVPAR